MPADQHASKCYDQTDDEYYYDYGCTIVSTGRIISISAEFTESKQVSEETAMRVTRDALAVGKSGWLVTAPTTRLTGTTTYWAQGRATRAIQRTERDRKEIEYRVEDHIEKHT